MNERIRMVRLRDALIPPVRGYNGAGRERASGGRVLFALFESELPGSGLRTAHCGRDRRSIPI